MHKTSFKEYISEGPILDKIKNLFKGKETKDEDLKLQELTDEDRKFITKHMPHNNADIKWNKEQDGSMYVLPTNVTAYSGHGRINFYKRKGQLTAGVGYYRSGSDAQNPKVSPIVHFDEKISSDDDMKKLKEKLL